MDRKALRLDRRAILPLTVVALLAILMGVRAVQCRRHEPPPPPPVADSDAMEPVYVPIHMPIRREPDRFPANTHLPNIRESLASGPVIPGTFSAGRDLVFVDDERVWWESDSDGDDDDECDHSIHKTMEIPLRRLIELVSQEGGRLKVQDAYRPAGIHNSRSLHKEGRALDVTCDEMPLEKLAKLCWAAGFDWVFYERGRGGPHVHASVRSDPMPIPRETLTSAGH